MRYRVWGRHRRTNQGLQGVDPEPLGGARKASGLESQRHGEAQSGVGFLVIAHVGVVGNAGFPSGKRAGAAPIVDESGDGESLGVEEIVAIGGRPH